ncbi:MAG: thiamine pyrophosphate-dependent enzyme, partial [Spirochaetota bacterium]|nr:thiamine pyrophosphate-dependent enzyme [Spirochaetota bacterium]
DGGATIGLQHILECARRNVNMTVLILNNLIYGMTGGQISGLSSSQFKLERHTIEENIPHYDIIRLAHEAGAAYTSRILSHRDYESSLVEAIEKKGFSLVEIIGLCQPYGLHKNKEISATGYEELHLDQDRQAFELYETEKPSLFADLKGVRTISKHSLNEPISIVIAGAAGEGVQYAARLLANAAMSVGLHVSLKGEYPITVGTGFSIAEVILSPCEIRYTGIEIPDVLIVTAKEGRDRVAGRYIDVPYLVQDKDTAELPAKVKLRASFRAVSGPKDAVLSAIAYWIRKNKVLPLDVLYQAVKGQKHEDKLRATLNKTAQLP